MDICILYGRFGIVVDLRDHYCKKKWVGYGENFAAIFPPRRKKKLCALSYTHTHDRQRISRLRNADLKLSVVSACTMLLGRWLQLITLSMSEKETFTSLQVKPVKRSFKHT